MTTVYSAQNALPFSSLPTTNGVVQRFRASATNVADASYAPDGLAEAPIYGLAGRPLQGDEIVAGGNVTLVSHQGGSLNNGALCWILLECEGGAQQVANATRSQHAVTLGQLSGYAGAAPGDIKYTAASVATEGWLKADGANVSRTAFSALFAAIGTTYGQGDGSTTFTLPDLRGEFIRGHDGGRGVDQDRVLGSRQKGSLYAYDTTESKPNGIWSASATQNTAPASRVAMGVDAYSTSDYAGVALGGVDATVVYQLPGMAADRGYSGVMRPRNVAMLALIKY
ncbi:phage tail protein [uncultured Pseudomonas sp.]|uniref:phage tail protein n=1 Tax=uncultured Pseudomonas sp. TaxID=114707 RepID=UPI0025E4BE49|nr:phage tail protein [uncultured Pseudomonas sp.]